MPISWLLASVFGVFFIALPGEAAETDLLKEETSSPVIYEEVRQKYETRISEQIQELLEKVVGNGLVSVSVSAEVDFSQNIINNEVIDANSPIVVSSKINGAQEETIYAFSKKVTKQVQNGGLVKKISVAVLLDSSVSPIVLPHLQTLVKTAIGFDEVRGDKIEFITASFKKNSWKAFMQKLFSQSLEIVFLILILVGVIVFILFKSFKTHPIQKSPLPDFAQPEKVEQVLKSSQETTKNSEPILKQVHDRINKNPQDAVTVIRSWMYQGGEEVSNG